MIFRGRDGLEAAWMPRMAAEDSFDSHSYSGPQSVGFDRFHDIAGAGRIESAGGREERRDQPLVEADRQ